ncbi:LOW QUALITY PROTEIN: hypothetical protein U9M48_042273 [Paspalum notatum var. saurae]|uniref:RRM domain-containing protein n=1 Tax=Paspalum notatum var. saurae TaxID=547442 RepID=A0AAQ3UQ78_PASNO
MARYNDRYDYDDQYDRYGRHGSNTKLYVGQISSHTRTEDLEELFSKYGRLRNVDLKTDFGFVEFIDHRDAQDAMYDLDGRKFDGSRIIVEFARGEVSVNMAEDLLLFLAAATTVGWMGTGFVIAKLVTGEIGATGEGEATQGPHLLTMKSTKGEATQGPHLLAMKSAKGEATQGPHLLAMKSAEGEATQGPHLLAMKSAKGEATQGPLLLAMKSAKGEATQGPLLLAMKSAKGEAAQVGHHRQRGIAVMLVVKNCRQEAPDPGGAHHQGSKLHATAHIMVKPMGRASDPEFGTETEFSNASAERCDTGKVLSSHLPSALTSCEKALLVDMSEEFRDLIHAVDVGHVRACLLQLQHKLQVPQHITHRGTLDTVLCKAFLHCLSKLPQCFRPDCPGDALVDDLVKLSPLLPLDCPLCKPLVRLLIAPLHCEFAAILHHCFVDLPKPSNSNDHLLIKVVCCILQHNKRNSLVSPLVPDVRVVRVVVRLPVVRKLRPLRGVQELEVRRVGGRCGFFFLRNKKQITIPMMTAATTPRTEPKMTPR